MGSATRHCGCGIWRYKQMSPVARYSLTYNWIVLPSGRRGSTDPASFRANSLALIWAGSKSSHFWGRRAHCLDSADGPVALIRVVTWIAFKAFEVLLTSPTKVRIRPDVMVAKNIASDTANRSLMDCTCAAEYQSQFKAATTMYPRSRYARPSGLPTRTRTLRRGTLRPERHRNLLSRVSEPTVVDGAFRQPL